VTRLFHICQKQQPSLEYPKVGYCILVGGITPTHFFCDFSSRTRTFHAHRVFSIENPCLYTECCPWLCMCVCTCDVCMLVPPVHCLKFFYLKKRHCFCFIHLQASPVYLSLVPFVRKSVSTCAWLRLLEVISLFCRISSLL